MHGMALPGRTVGLTLSVGCFYVIALVCFALVQVVTLGSKESWWEMCETVPCNSRSQPAVHSQLNSCPATAFHPDADPNAEAALAEVGFDLDLTGACEGKSSKACNQHKCELLKERVMMLDHGEESVACLRQFRLPNGEWSSFGAVCCTVCDYGQMGDTDAVFRSWSTKRQACGLFSCKQDGHDPHNDFCPDRREYARVAQAFTVVSMIFVSFLAAFHFSELFSLTRDVNRRVPLPHAMKELRDWVRMYAHYAHYLTGVLLLFAAVFATITLSKEFCGVRLASYVHARFGVRVLWGGACMVVWVTFLGFPFFPRSTIARICFPHARRPYSAVTITWRSWASTVCRGCASRRRCAQRRELVSRWLRQPPSVRVCLHTRRTRTQTHARTRTHLSGCNL